MTHSEKAVELYDSRKYNCAQAVAVAFADIVGFSESYMRKISEAFGSGGGNMEGTCGAVAGAQMIIGLLNSSGDENNDTRANTRKKSKELLEAFKEKNGSVICKELKGVGTGKVLRECRGCVADAAQILEGLI